MPSLGFVPGIAPLISSTGTSGLCKSRPIRRPRASTLRRKQVIATAQPPGVSSVDSNEGASPPPASKPAKRVGLVTILLVIGAVLWALLISAVMFVTRLLRFPSDKNQKWSASLTLLWMRDIMRTAFVRVKVHGRENLPSGASLVVANSQSPLDMFALAFLRLDLRFMAPTRAFTLPILGWMLARAGWIGVGGVDRKSQMKTLGDIGSKLTEGSSVAIFPEGGMSQSGVMKRFPSIAFRPARKSGVPIVPVTIHGGGSMGEGLVPYKYPKDGIQVTVHPPISLDSGSDKEIAQQAYEVIRSGLPAHLH